MTLIRLMEGGLHEPNSSDWDDICATVGPDAFFQTLFHDVGGVALPAAEITEQTEGDIQRVRKGRRGTEIIGAHITQRECTDTSDLPTYCRWETYGLPGMTVTWNYALEYAGQLGHVAFRHLELLADFEGPVARERFSDVWRRVFGVAPTFEPA